MKKYKEHKQFRLQGYDYSSEGWYFVTICTKDKINYFGNIVKGKMFLSKVGRIVKNCWVEIPKHFPQVILREYVVMPNHIHGIILIENSDVVVGAQNLAFPDYKNKFGPQSKNLSSIIRGFKVGVTKNCKHNNLDFYWQPRFHDRIIRNQKELDKIRNYILKNPLIWHLDRHNKHFFD